MICLLKLGCVWYYTMLIVMFCYVDNTPVMASGSPSGHIALWDLERKRLVSTIYDAHYGTVCGMHFLQSQPLLVSTGTDNSLKVWTHHLRLVLVRDTLAAWMSWSCLFI